MTQKWPEIPPELVVFLDALVPHRCIDPRQTVAENWLYAGRRSLVDDLIRMLRRQQNLNLETTRVLRTTEHRPSPARNPSPHTPGT